MLIKQIFNDADFETALKKRERATAAVSLVGILGLVCYFLLVKGSDLPDFAQGFYQGASGGMCFAGIILLARIRRLRKDPEARKKAKIEETDERQKAIFHRAFALAGQITFFAAAAALFVLVPLSRTATRAVLAVTTLYAVTFLVSCKVLEKTM